MSYDNKRKEKSNRPWCMANLKYLIRESRRFMKKANRELHSQLVMLYRVKVQSKVALIIIACISTDLPKKLPFSSQFKSPTN